MDARELLATAFGTEDVETARSKAESSSQNDSQREATYMSSL